MKFDFTKVVFVGDSLVDDTTNVNVKPNLDISSGKSDVSEGTNVGINYFQWDSSNHWSYTLARVFDFDYKNTAYCGKPIKEIFEQHLNEWIFDHDPTFVFIDGGVNDVGNFGISADNAVEYMRQTIQTVLDKGIQVGFIWFPVDSSKFLGSTKSNIVYLPAKYNTMANNFKTSYPDDFIYFNFEGITNFGTTSTGSSTIPQDYRRDGLHFNQAGYKITAEYMIQKIKEADSSLSDMQVEAGASVIIRG